MRCVALQCDALALKPDALRRSVLRCVAMVFPVAILCVVQAVELSGFLV